VGGWDPFGQASLVYQAQTAPLLRVDYTQVLGMQPAYTLVDLAAGVEREGISVQLFVTNVADRRANLTRFAEISPQRDNQVYVIPSQPRTIALRFAQRF
jgi:iron complex outermembrane recepter protein